LISFRTESGSIYTLGDGQWASSSSSTRTSGGPMMQHSEVRVGDTVVIVGPGLVEGMRLIETSPVVEIIKPGESQPV
jgi:hypothetical protein